MKNTFARLGLSGCALLVAALLAGCAADIELNPGPVPGGEVSTPTAPQVDPTGPGDAEEERPAEQAASCEWERPTLVPAAAPAVPEGRSGELRTVLIGSWQHTHLDSGSGLTPVEDKDIRYVFPAADQLIYCQHVPGITDHAENRAPISLDGDTILPPSPHPGFEVLAWSGDTMLWQNNFDGSQYLLVRR